MGVNWLPGMNPETNPKLCYIPKIALPTVFGDALSYMEMINQINYHFNKAIDDINNLADNITKVVAETVENAKIPVYANLVHNGSHIISANNWNIDKPADIWDGMANGKMCILFGQLAFNIDGIPVVQNNNNMYFILTEYYQMNINDDSANARAMFVNYDYSAVRYLDMQFEKNGDNINTEVIAFTEYALPTSDDLIALSNMFKRDVCVYKGENRIPSEENAYIELTDNATIADLSEFFVVETDGSIIAPNCAPFITVDYYNGCVGELRYGGAGTPWARIYSCGVRFNGDLRSALSDVNASIVNLGDTVVSMQIDIGRLSDDLTDLEDRINETDNNIESLSDECVKYVGQTATNTQKAIARNNIGAAPTQDPQFTGELVLNSGYGAAVNFTVDKSGNNTILYFDPVRVQINGVLDPTSAQMVATKNYVDSAIESADCVKYSAQNKTSEEQEQARENIGAVGVNSPHFYTQVDVENNNKVLSIIVGNSNGQKTVTLGGTTGDALVKNVADPVVEGDAANKRYVDNKIGEVNNAVLYTQQVLTPSQKYTARTNIDARGLDNESFTGNFSIFTTENMNEGTIVQLDWESSDGTVVKTAFAHMNNNGLKIVDSDDNGFPIYIGNNDNDRVATINDLITRYTPLAININNEENAWTILNPPAPAYNLLGNIIQAYTTGKPILVYYPTTGVAGIGYASPKCASVDTGIIVEAFNGTAWKRYTINSDGTVTTSSV